MDMPDARMVDAMLNGTFVGVGGSCCIEEGRDGSVIGGRWCRSDFREYFDVRGDVGSSILDAQAGMEM